MAPEKNEVTEHYECPFLPQCRFIQNNIQNMPELIQRTQDHFCTVSDAACARRYLYKTVGPQRVPDLLLPKQAGWAEQIIEVYEEGQDSQTQPVSVDSEVS